MEKCKLLWNININQSFEYLCPNEDIAKRTQKALNSGLENIGYHAKIKQPKGWEENDHWLMLVEPKYWMTSGDERFERIEKIVKEA